MSLADWTWGLHSHSDRQMSRVVTVQPTQCTMNPVELMFQKVSFVCHMFTLLLVLGVAGRPLFQTVFQIMVQK